MSDTKILDAVSANDSGTYLFELDDDQRMNERNIARLLRKVRVYAHGTFGSGNVSFTVPLGGVDIELANFTANGSAVIEIEKGAVVKATLAGATTPTLTAGISHG